VGDVEEERNLAGGNETLKNPKQHNSNIKNKKLIL
jgi:hypothetical protein